MADLETDYLIVGAGAMGLAFADTLLSETDADMIIVDRRAAPGGHWLDAYPCVRLHQPSAFYGVASRELGGRRIDEAGSNKGFLELASGPEVTAYFDAVMRERLLPSGRVRFMAMTELVADERIRGLLSRKEMLVDVRRRTVDATYLNTTIPSVHKPRFRIEGGAICIPPNGLPRRAPDHGRYVILGGGKTAMDVGVWLLENGADPCSITWVRPRESWLINRASTQPGMAFFHSTMGGFADQMEAMASAQDCKDLCDRLEACGYLLRIDPERRPEMIHFATISEGEVRLLQAITDVETGGRVATLSPNALEFADGRIRALENSPLFIDCTASAVERRPVRPVFEPGRITLQMVRLPAPTFSAALAAHLEASREDDEEKNRLCNPAPLCDTPEQWMTSMVWNMMNQFVWSQDRELRKWIADCRLDGFGAMARDADRSDPAVAAVFERIRAASAAAVGNLQRLIAATPGASQP